ncbi:hypothetical protein XU18_1600 [Perkinsela sp. CCAP 1560/4]|nr:hypothetical protein XU18_1600 [Perkinsela sp. CCAP 1560/4]|eukprot:KNH07709.1 hypothetical protein XU18_1600 [Perkinsela sp. CCAP 1560/4]
MFFSKIDRRTNLQQGRQTFCLSRFLRDPIEINPRFLLAIQFPNVLTLFSQFTHHRIKPLCLVYVKVEPPLKRKSFSSRCLLQRETTVRTLPLTVRFVLIVHYRTKDALDGFRVKQNLSKIHIDRPYESHKLITLSEKLIQRSIWESNRSADPMDDLLFVMEWIRSQSLRRFGGYASPPPWRHLAKTRASSINDFCKRGMKFAHGNDAKSINAISWYYFHGTVVLARMTR